MLTLKLELHLTTEIHLVLGINLVNLEQSSVGRISLASTADAVFSFALSVYIVSRQAGILLLRLQIQ